MNDPQNLNITVVIVNYNSGGYLKNCLKSLQGSIVGLDIVVVDNNSSDGSLEDIERCVTKPHQINILKNTQNLGFSKAVNQGAQNSEKTYITLINPDCTAFPGTFFKLQQLLDSDKKIGIAGALVFNSDGTEQRGCRRNDPTLKRSLVTVLGMGKKREGIDMTYQKIPSQAVEVDAVSGAAMMIRREYFDQLGGMDEDYFLHCEDLDLCRRMWDSQYKVMFHPAASIFHRQGASALTTSFVVERHKHRGMEIYSKKFPEPDQSVLGKALTVLLIRGHFWFGVIIGGLRSMQRIIGVKPRNNNQNHGVSALDISHSRNPVILVTGGKSDVGDFLLKHLSTTDYQCFVVSRSKANNDANSKNIHWLSLDYFNKTPIDDFGEIDIWINLAPVWTTRNLATVFHQFKPKKIIALSSTSILGKADSESESDLDVVNRLLSGEKWLENYSKEYNLEAVILRPTLIYGGPRNQNINFIEQLIKIIRIFPLIGDGAARRQPIHAEDVGIAVKLVMGKNLGPFAQFTICGGEEVSYRQMVTRIFEKCNIKSRFIPVPLRPVKTVMSMVNKIPGLRFLDPEMAQRMTMDLVYSNKPAKTAFSFLPRKFKP